MKTRARADKSETGELPAVARVAHLCIGTSSWVDLALVAERMAVIAALAVSVLVKVGVLARSLMDLLPFTALALR